MHQKTEPKHNSGKATLAMSNEQITQHRRTSGDRAFIGKFAHL
ncbi:hypothetical protein [Pseudanabaena sp. ABRG5-3]|nr:hypothetical protein [Pseudanabaena sp. ABRG5-3]